MLPRVAFRSEDEVLEDREVAKLVRNLPRLREAQVHNLVRRQAVDPRAVKPDLPAVGAVEACNDVEQRGLPGPIWTDEAGDGLREDRQTAPVHGLDPTERLLDGVHPENRFGGHP